MMGSKALWIRGAVAALAFAVPAIALAQLPNTYQTPGATLKVDAKRVCAADFEASLKPVANWQRDQALERYGERPESFKATSITSCPYCWAAATIPTTFGRCTAPVI